MSSHTDNAGTRFGMWLFLYTELMLFGGLFVLYAVYYYKYSNDFTSGGAEMELFYGTLNTAILLTSSFCVAASIEAIKKNSKKLAIVLLYLTCLFGIIFLMNKYVEWSNKFSHGIYPGSERLAGSAKGVQIFFGLYFTLTGLHALHVLIGTSLMGTCLFLTEKGKITGSKVIILENSGLYWHLVDIIWIFIFPLFYLIL